MLGSSSKSSARLGSKHTKPSTMAQSRTEGHGLVKPGDVDVRHREILRKYRAYSWQNKRRSDCVSTMSSTVSVACHAQRSLPSSMSAPMSFISYTVHPREAVRSMLSTSHPVLRRSCLSTRPQTAAGSQTDGLQGSGPVRPPRHGMLTNRDGPVPAVKSSRGCSDG